MSRDGESQGRSKTISYSSTMALLRPQAEGTMERLVRLSATSPIRTRRRARSASSISTPSNLPLLF